jgi:hypothetical protein
MTPIWHVSMLFWQPPLQQRPSSPLQARPSEPQ